MTRPLTRLSSVAAIVAVALAAGAAPVRADADTTPPTVLALSFAPTTVDVSDGPAAVEATLVVEDDLSGPAPHASALISSPNGAASLLAGFTRQADGSYRATVHFPRHAATGTWQDGHVVVRDNAGNSRLYPFWELRQLAVVATIEVTGTGDATPPTVRELSFSPTTIDVGAGPATVEASLVLEDDLSAPAPDAYLALFQSTAFPPVGASLTRRADGRYTGTLTFHAGTPTGTWRVFVLFVRDNAANTRTYAADELAALGFPTAVEVVLDLTAPTLIVPGDLAVDATSPEGAVVTYDVQATDVVDASPAVVCTPPSGRTFAIGDTTVRCSATDASGNTASATFTVHVRGATEQLHELRALIAGYELEHGFGAELSQPLNLAIKDLAREQTGHARQEVRQFLAAVDRATTKTPPRLTATQAAALADAGGRILAVLGD